MAVSPHVESAGSAAALPRPRYALLDEIRGVTLVSMILYHAVWDLVWLFGVDWAWYRGIGAFVWQQSICWTFIFLSGFCLSLGRRTLRRGLEVWLGGALVSAVTLLFLPEAPIRFGVLTLIGSCMLLAGLARPVLDRCPALPGLLASLTMFVLTRNCPEGFLGFGPWNLAPLPRSWYSNLPTAFLGFPPADFFSTDYFPLIPWSFLFLGGLFAFRLCRERGLLPRLNREPSRGLLRPAAFLGRKSLWVYLLHQPVLYAILFLVFSGR